MAAALGLARGGPRAATAVAAPAADPAVVVTAGGKAVPTATLTAVADALRASAALVVDAEGKRVRRAAPLRPAAEVAAEADGRSLYATPFPHDASLDALAAFFEAAAAAALGGDSKAGGAAAAPAAPAAVASVRMRRHLASKDFKGSVFVEFTGPAAAAAILAALPAAKEGAAAPSPPDPSEDPAAALAGHPAWLVFEGAPVRVEAKSAFVERKLADRAAAAAARAAAGEAEPAGDAPAAVATPAKADGADGGAAAAPAATAAPAVAAAPLAYEPGKVVAFTLAADAPGAAALTYNEVKAAFGGREAGAVFVEYEDGGTSGAVRFKSAEDAGAAVAKGGSEAGLVLCGAKAAVSLLEGEAEVAYYARSTAARARAEAAGGGGGRGGRGGGGRGGGGRGGGRGRGGGGRGGGFKRGRDGGGGGRGGAKRARAD